jgi:large subunit ribosomal protein L9
MKVILLRDVAKIGRRHEIIEVADGMALNRLIPRGDAAQATPENVKRVLNLRQKGVANKADLLSSLKAIADTFVAEPLLVPMQANEQGHLFKGVHADDVLAAARGRGVVIAKEYLVVENHLKSLGIHQVALKGQGNIFNFPINVQAK